MSRSMIARQNIKLNLVPGGVPPVLNVSQNDSAYDVHFTLYNGAQLFEIPDDVSIQFVEKKRDGNGYDVGATKSAQTGQCYIWMQKQMTAVPGDQICELILTNTTEDQIGTANFIMRVEPGPVDDDTSFSDSDIAYANQVLAQLGSVAAYKAQLDAQGDDIEQLNTDLAAEVAARQAADNTLQSNINSEASTRATADASLQSQINQLVAPEGAAPSAAEIENARVGADGTVYSTLGDAIRTQDTQLKNALDQSLNAGLTNIRQITDLKPYFTKNMRVNSGILGSTLDPESTATEAGATRRMAYYVFPVQKGDIIYYFGKQADGTTRKSIALTDESYVVKQTTPTGAITTAQKFVLTAKQNGYCFLNAITRLSSVDSDFFAYHIAADTYAKLLQDASRWEAFKLNGYINIEGAWEVGEFEGFSTNPGAIKSPVIALESDTVFWTTQNYHINIYRLVGSTWVKSGGDSTRWVNLPKGTQLRIAIWKSGSNPDPAVDYKYLYMSCAASPSETLKTTYSSPAIFGTIGIIGDSYALGSMHWENSGYHGYSQYSWGKLMCKRNGNECKLYAHGGYGISAWLTNILPTLLADDPCNLYWWGMGINDVSSAYSATSRGSIEDITSHSSYEDYPNTLYGNYGKAIEQVKAHAPLAKHVIASCIGSSVNHRYDASSYKNINDVLIEIAGYYGIPFIEITDDPFYFSAFYANNIVSNHPTLIGYGGMSYANERLLNKCIVENEAYFLDYGRTNAPEDVDPTGQL